MTGKNILKWCLISLGGFLLLGLSGGIVFYWFLPRWAMDPMEILSKQTPLRIFTDRNGKLLYVQRTYEGQWRFHVPLEEIAPIAVQMVLAVEDRNFFQHSGVDFTAVFRAFRQNLSSGKVISGASTISMQLASMSLSGPRRSWLRKLKQILRARRLESLYPKKKILEEYLNRIPMGGNLYGLESGARYYFGRKAANLNESESALLCGLPQRPNAWRPDRHMKKAIRRRDLVLYILERQKILTPERVKAIKQQSNLRFRSFQWKADFMVLGRTPEKMYFDRAAREVPPGQYRIVCAFREESAWALREILLQRCKELPGVSSASGVILENKTGEVTALVGSVEAPDQKGSQINGAFALRSAGSSLKPFLYAEAASGGMLVDDTVLLDLPMRYGNYVPVNFDGTYRGEIPAWEALADSLNIPAIRLAADLKEERVLKLFQSLHLFSPGSKADSSGLSLALGSAGHTLFALTNAYRVFSGDGVWRPCTFLAGKYEKEPAEGVRIFVPGTGSMISRMLSRRSLPSSIINQVSWKTGTSNGNRDAWCFAWTPQWTVGVWFGNKDNRPSEALNGFEAAAPAAGRIISFLHGSSYEGNYREHYQKVRLCRESGLRSSHLCKNTYDGQMLEFAPLKRCPHNKVGKKDLAIRTPVPGKYYLREREKKITLTLACTDDSEKPHWMLNGKYLGRFPDRRMEFGQGVYTLRMIPENGNISGKSVNFVVE